MSPESVQAGCLLKGFKFSTLCKEKMTIHRDGSAFPRQSSDRAELPFRLHYWAKGDGAQCVAPEVWRSSSPSSSLSSDFYLLGDLSLSVFSSGL